MPTKLYLHDATMIEPGTYPNVPRALSDWALSGSASLRQMNTTIGAGQTSLSGNSLAQTTTQEVFLGMWISPPLDGAQTVGGGTILTSFAEAESNLNANFWWKGGRIYVHRPSTGGFVGSLNVGFAIGSEPSSAGSEQVSTGSVASSGISAQDGDVIVFESFASFIQGMATSYACTIYFDGTTENTTENAVVSNHASFIQLNENLVFKGATPPPAQKGRFFKVM